MSTELEKIGMSVEVTSYVKINVGDNLGPDNAIRLTNGEALDLAEKLIRAAAERGA